MTAFFPSLVLWSSLNLKDALAVASILVCVRGAQRLSARLSIGSVATIGLGLAILGELRGYLALVAAARSLSRSWCRVSVGDAPRSRSRPCLRSGLS